MKMLADTRGIKIDNKDKKELVGDDLNGIADQLITRHKGQI